MVQCMVMSRITFVLLFCISFQLIVLSIPKWQEIVSPSQYLSQTSVSEKKYPLPASFSSSVHVPILLYHYISHNPFPQDTVRTGLSTTPQIFEKQLLTLIQYGYTTISLDELFQSLITKTALPQKPVVLTFDDGYEDFYTNAYPLLRKYNMKATQFIPTGLIGKPNYMTWDQITELSQSELITIGAHTVEHVFLPKQSDERLETEVLQSKNMIEEIIQQPVHWFAYPYGAFTEREVAMVKKSGFKGAVSTIKGTTHDRASRYTLTRVRPGNFIFNDFLIILQ